MIKSFINFESAEVVKDKLETAAVNFNFKKSDLLVLVKAILYYESDLARLSADTSCFVKDVEALASFKKKFSFLFEFEWLKS